MARERGNNSDSNDFLRSRALAGPDFGLAQFSNRQTDKVDFRVRPKQAGARVGRAKLNQLHCGAAADDDSKARTNQKACCNLACVCSALTSQPVGRFAARQAAANRVEQTQDALGRLSA